MRGFVANTDWEWFSFLRAQGPLEEINFWRPSARTRFGAIAEGEPFFFKLKSPHNAIGGFGIYARYSSLPLWLAWDCFDLKNGAPSLPELSARIAPYNDEAKTNPGGQFNIGCRMISQPVFFPDGAWVELPDDWSQNIMGGKTYDLASGEGARIWSECQLRASQSALAAGRAVVVAENFHPGYGREQLVRPRLGQGTFRVAVTDAYGRACAVTTEHSLPVLDVAHIKPYAQQGPHDVGNGLLLRSDIHRLFDRGYVTVTKELKFEVSGRLKQDFENGRTYYELHGRKIGVPERAELRPRAELLEWHQDNVYR